MAIIMRLNVEPRMEPNFTNLPVMISDPGMNDANVDATEEYKTTKKIALVVSNDLNFVPVCLSFSFSSCTCLKSFMFIFDDSSKAFI